MTLRSVQYTPNLNNFNGVESAVYFNHTSSDQLSQYGTKFVPVPVRDSTYVLGEIYNNETELPIREHTTDTAGATGDRKYKRPFHPCP